MRGLPEVTPALKPNGIKSTQGSNSNAPWGGQLQNGQVRRVKNCIFT